MKGLRNNELLPWNDSSGIKGQVIEEENPTLKHNILKMNPETISLLFFVFMLSVALGFELISKVPSMLHTPLMSGSNAISGIALVGAVLAAVAEQSDGIGVALGVGAVVLATINVVGGYLVTDRMLEMFKKKNKGQP
jgi:NAD(P) transhydrogenase subunit alpha